ncbi:MAG: molybdopterin-dependent oxidoreductase [Nocardioides sp.]|nr:molybdopterin-dependent oxidoreductase [Nocardioides sp.]
MNFPRFADQPLRRPPRACPLALRVSAAGREDLVLGEEAFAALPMRDQDSDFHCVTTWSYRGVQWGGVRMREFWHEVVLPWVGEEKPVPWVRARGGDAGSAVLCVEDLLADDVLLAVRLDGRPLDARHGAPLRLVCPSQYGYKSVKHLVGLELLQELPVLPSKEHLRARVALEERHPRLPARLVRRPYRALIPITVRLAEWSLARSELVEEGDAVP